MKTLGISILAVAFFAVSNVCNAQQDNSVNDKQNATEQVTVDRHMHGMPFGRGFRHHRAGFAPMAMTAREGFQAMRPASMMMPRLTELSEEQLAKMSKKDRRDYKKAVKQARKEMKLAQEQIKSVKEYAEASLEERMNVVQEIQHTMHIAKRYTQKANRIAFNQNAEA